MSPVSVGPCPHAEVSWQIQGGLQCEWCGAGALAIIHDLKAIVRSDRDERVRMGRQSSRLAYENAAEIVGNTFPVSDSVAILRNIADSYRDP